MEVQRVLSLFKSREMLSDPSACQRKKNLNLSPHTLTHTLHHGGPVSLAGSNWIYDDAAY